MRIGEYWCEQYKKTRGIPYPAHKRGEWIQLEKVAKRYGQDVIRWCIYTFLRGYGDDAWVVAQGWGLFSFQSRINGLLLQARARKNQRMKSEIRKLARSPRVARLADGLADKMEGGEAQTELFGRTT